MRNLCYGGSFNPIHHGHLICARAAAEIGGFDRVVLIPTANPPHKPNSPDLAPAHDRLEMCRLAVKNEPVFGVDDIELHRTGPSYTLDTARELAKRWNFPVSWLIGADMLQYLPNWHEPQTLVQEVDLVIMARPGWKFDFKSLPPEFRGLERNVVATPLVDISATDIRKRVKAGKSIEYLVPESISQYVKARRLYR